MNALITSEELYRGYHSKVARYISAHVQNAHDREDLLQQVFLNAISALDSYDPSRSAVGTWLYTVTRNTVIDYYRKKEHEPVPTELDELDLFPAESEEKTLTSETLEALASALEKLPQRERNIIIYRFYYGISAKETAEKVGVSYSNVRFLQYSALKKLRRLLEETGLF